MKNKLYLYILVSAFIVLGNTALLAQGIGADSVRLRSSAGGSAWLSLPSSMVSNYRLIFPSTLNSLTGQLMIVDGITGQVSLLSPGSAGQLLQFNGSNLGWTSIASITNGTVTNATMRWSGSAWIENPTILGNTTGGLTLGGSLQSGSLVISDGTLLPKYASIYTNTLAANRVYTVPDAGANASFVMTEGNQSINGSKTFSSAPIYSSLTGILIGNGSGALSTATITGTTNQIGVTNGNGTAGNPIISLASDAVLPGTGAVTVPTGNSSQQPASPSNGMLRYNTTSGRFEFYQSGSWVTFTTGGASLAAGTASDATLRWSGSAWIENTNVKTNAGTLTLGSNATAGSTVINDGNGQTATLSLADVAANRIYTIPEVGNNANFVMTEGTQTVNGSKTFGSTITISPFSTAGVVKNNASGVLSTGTVLLSSTNDVSGVLPVANGGTGASTLTGLVVGNGTSAMTTATITGTANQVSVTNGNGTGGNPTIAIASDAVFPGTGSNTIVTGTTIQRPGSPSNGMMRYNSTTGLFEFYQGGAWVNYSTGSASLGAGTTNNTTLRYNSATSQWVENTSILATSTGSLTMGGNSQAGSVSLSDGAVTANTATITSATQGTNRTYTIPNAGNNANFVMTEGAQTVNGSKTFGSTITISPFSTAGVVKNNASGVLSTGTVLLSSTNDVSGVLPVANGGTGASTLTGLVVGNGTSAMTTTTITGTTNQVSVTNGNGTGVNQTIAIASDAVFPGTGSNTIVLGTTLQRPGSPNNGMIRYNSTTGLFEFYQGGTWVNYSTGGGSLGAGTANNTTLRYNSATSQWVENTSILATSTGGITAGGNSQAGSVSLSDGAVTANTATITSATQGANRTYTIPNAGNNANFVMTEGTQTINGSKSFTSNLLLTNSGTATELRLYEPSASGNNYTAFKAAAQSTDLTYTWPTSGPSAGQVLSSDASGNLSWIAPSTGSITGSGSNTQVAFFTGATSLASSSNMIWDNTNSRLGIFSSSPSARLQVGGRIMVTIGTDNTFLSGGNETVSGTLNTGIGYNALAGVTSGGSNVALGRNTLSSLTTTSNNTAIGTGAMGVASGSNNIALGYQAGDALTTGSNNIIIGYDIDAPSATGSNQLDIGNLLYGSGLSSTGTTISTGNIGIGYNAPSQRLHVAGNILVDTSAASTAGKIIFNNPARTFATSFKAGAQTANLDYTLPTAAPTAGYILSSDASGNLSWIAPTTGSVTGSGTATQVAFWSSSSAITSSSNLYWDNTNNRLGIGTGATVSAPLHIINSTGAQVRLGYDVSNYTTFTAMNNGNFGVNPTGGLTSFTGMVSTSNTLMVSAGGASITGNSTVTGTLGVSSNVSLTNSGTASELRLFEPNGSGTNFTAFKAQAQAADVTYTLPAADATTSGMVLSSNASGTLSWVGNGASITNGVSSPSA
ncbi:MAG: hypothetical protein JNJ85_13555, partial [Candidatus Kapabacteria bacterium]|nr:hypothetical protein [Candidatus Kapabacteria bacterium]